MRPLLAALLAVGLALPLVGCTADTTESFSIGAGTTLVDSGFMDGLVTEYQRAHPGVEISVIGLSSAEAFAYARAFTVEVIITHDKAGLSDYLLLDNPNAETSVPFKSSFVLVGPRNLYESRLISPKTLVGAFEHLAQGRHEFVSRDDGSGTHVREQAIWSLTGVDPTNAEWYTRTGSGMGATLQVADQRRAYTLSELGSFLTAHPVLNLVVTPYRETDLLENPYDVTVVGLDKGAPMAFARWLSSDEGAAAITRVNDELFNRPVYVVP